MSKSTELTPSHAERSLRPSLPSTPCDTERRQVFLIVWGGRGRPALVTVVPCLSFSHEGCPRPPALPSLRFHLRQMARLWSLSPFRLLCLLGAATVYRKVFVNNYVSIKESSVSQGPNSQASRAQLLIGSSQYSIQPFSLQSTQSPGSNPCETSQACLKSQFLISPFSKLIFDLNE